jgi:AraC family transcriptional regulator
MKPGTERDYRRRIARVVAAIVAEPGAPHTVESLAAIAHLSPYHFHRIYKRLTGETVAETVQRFRLADAANRLTSDVDTVTDVAADVGYDSAQAFARAFRKFTGVSPGQFRARQLDIMESRKVPTDRSCDADCAQKIATVELPSITVLGLRHDGPTSTISHTYGRYCARLVSTMHRTAATFDRPVRLFNLSLRQHAGIPFTHEQRRVKHPDR